MGLFCKAPFCYLGINANGTIQPCCINNLSIDISHKSLLDIWFGEEFERVRKSIEDLDCDYYYCNYCKSLGMTQSCPARVYDSFFVNDNRMPSFIKFSNSNKCNLKCAMCNEVYSSSFTNHEQSCLLDNNFIEQLDDLIPCLKAASFSGGEPLLIPAYRQIIKRMKIVNPEACIHLTTNGTIFNDTIGLLLDSENVFLTLSADSIVENTYQVIRRGAQLETFMAHLDHFAKLSCHVDVNICLTSINLLDLAETISFFSNLNMAINVVIAKHPVTLSLYYVDNDQLDGQIEDVMVAINGIHKTSEITSQNVAKAITAIESIIDFRGQVKKRNAEVVFYEEFKRALRSSSYNNKKSDQDIDDILAPIPRYVFTENFVRCFFKFNSNDEMSKLMEYSNNTIQDYIISNSFYLA